jgi:alpha-galactosidase/6-phospho-beta-glucosidase family protein
LVFVLSKYFFSFFLSRLPLIVSTRHIYVYTHRKRENEEEKDENDNRAEQKNLIVSYEKRREGEGEREREKDIGKKKDISSDVFHIVLYEEKRHHSFVDRDYSFQKHDHAHFHLIDALYLNKVIYEMPFKFHLNA